MKSEFSGFTLSLEEGKLAWEGEVFAPFPHGQGPSARASLRIKVLYPDGFPCDPIRVSPLSPVLPLHLSGHKWHRWDDGSLCLGRPAEWDISYTARDAVEKSAIWWFNFLAYLFDHVESMPDIGQAILTLESVVAAG